MKNPFNNLSITFFFCIVLLSLTGCPPKETIKEEPPAVATPPAPKEFKKTGSSDMNIRFASIDLKDFPRKIEKKDIQDFVAKIKKEKIDIVGVQTITRYPNIKERIDIFEEIGKQTGMYKVFGETISMSGRVTGNAIYSEYPINSHDNIAYSGLKSVNLEAALFAFIDAGTRPLLTVSTRVPDKISDQQTISCLKMISKQKIQYEDTPMAILGNIYKPQKMDVLEGIDQPLEYNILSWKKAGNTQTIPVWFSSPDLQILNSTIIETELGLTLVTEFKMLGKTSQ